MGFVLQLPLPVQLTSVRNPKLSQRCWSGTVPDTVLHNTGGRYPNEKLPVSVPFNPSLSFLNPTSENQSRYPPRFRPASRSFESAQLPFRSASRTPECLFTSHRLCRTNPPNPSPVFPLGFNRGSVFSTGYRAKFPESPETLPLHTPRCLVQLWLSFTALIKSSAAFPLSRTVVPTASQQICVRRK